MEKFLQKKFAAPMIILAIIIGAFAVRFYNHEDWLYFKMDQSRDASMINNAVKNGPEYLPLLGPRAGATQVSKGYLRLGPAFYYFQYLSGKIFNSTSPKVLAYPDLFFSLAVLPLLYLLFRLYFSRKISLLMLILYAFSFLIIQYSRFAWNPNSLPFFMILSFYSLLRFFGAETARQKTLWISLWSVGIAIGSQLHFFGFFSLVGISGMVMLLHYQVWKKEAIRGLIKKEALKKFALYAGSAILFFGLIYIPVIISDVIKKGQNSKNFIEALSTKAEEKPFLDKVEKGIEEDLKYYCLVTTSECYSSDYLKNPVPFYLTMVILAGGLILAGWKLRRETGKKKDFIFLFLSWFAVFFILTIPVSFQLRPRFFIVVFAIPFISLGFIYEFLEEKLGKKGFYIAIAITALILFYNARGTGEWFAEQAKSQKSAFAVKRTLILKAKDGVTLGQLQKAADWMYARHRAGATLYFYVKPEHVMPIRYLLYQEQNKDFNYSPMKVNGDPNAEYFAITPSESDLSQVRDKFGDDFREIASQQFGQISVSQIEFGGRVVSEKFRFNRSKKNTDRIFWKDVFKIKSGNKNILEVVGDE